MHSAFLRATRGTARVRRLGCAVALVGAALVAAAGAVCGADRGGETQWRPLPLIADGKIDPAWIQIGWGGFAVEDGALRAEPDARGLGLLVYQRERLGNCQLRVVFKARDAKSNAGVYVRLADGILAQVGKPGAAFDRNAANKISKPSMEQVKLSAEREEGPWFAVHNGYEVQIMDSGDALHRTGAVYSFAPSSAPTRPGEWRTMLITLAGERIAVEIDGQRVADFDPQAADLPPRKNWPEPKRGKPRPLAGYIGLQNHDPGDIVWFKEVSVRALPAAAARPPADR